MPLGFDDEGYESRPNQVLASFVWTVYEDVESAVAMGTDFFVNPEVWSRIWGNAPSEAFSALREALPSVFNTRSEFITALLEVSSDELAVVGLHGAELRAKVRAWEYARYRLELALEIRSVQSLEVQPDESSMPDGVRPAKKLRRALSTRAVAATRRVAKWTKATLEQADTILGSVMKLIPQGERLLEIKETAENLAGNVADAMSDPRRTEQT